MSQALFALGMLALLVAGGTFFGVLLGLAAGEIRVPDWVPDWLLEKRN